MTFPIPEVSSATTPPVNHPFVFIFPLLPKLLYLTLEMFSISSSTTQALLRRLSLFEVLQLLLQRVCELHLEPIFSL